jgi:hypothetical protein
MSTHVIMLAPSPPSFRKAWRLVGHGRSNNKVWKRARTGDYTSELWSVAVLTHEVEPPVLPWNHVKLDVLQPRLLQAWKQENLAFLEQTSEDDLLECLRSSVVRYQLGLLGYVNAPEVHYVRTAEVQRDCSICLEPTSPLSIMTACRHSFCALCICEWRSRSDTCPLCRGDVDPFQIAKVETNPIVKRRVPLVQKQLFIRERMLAATKVIVISRYVNVLVSMSHNWSAHPVFYGIADACNFDREARGVWFMHLAMLNDLPDLSAMVDLVLVLEHSDITVLVNRMFTFAPVKPTIMTVHLNTFGDMIDPIKATGVALLTAFQDNN